MGWWWQGVVRQGINPTDFPYTKNKNKHFFFLMKG
jgi:hypothetical protein